MLVFQLKVSRHLQNNSTQTFVIIVVVFNWR